MQPVRLWICVCLLAVCGAGQRAEFRADVQLVNVGFSVRDAQRKLVTSLGREDFEVFEDGVPQKISFFARSVDVPLMLGLVVDISGSQSSFVRAHERDLRTFLTTALGPKDRAFLMCFGNRLRLVTDYSAPDKDLAAALAGFMDARDKSAYPELGPPETRILGTAFYDAIYYSATQMLGNVREGRKALLILSDGEDNSSAHHMMDAIEAAQSNNVLLFTVRYTEISGHRLNARNKYGMSVMSRIAKETGGADFDAREQGLVENFKAIGEELRSAYELGYHSTNTAADDTFHKISIRPKDASLTVRAKTGYYARVR